MLGGVGEQPQGHLQGPAAGAQSRLPGAGGELVRGQFRGDVLERGPGLRDGMLRGGDFLAGCGDGLVRGRGAGHAGGAVDDAGQVLLGGGEPGAGG